MNTKSFIALILSAMIVVIMIFASFQFGHNYGYTDGFSKGYNFGVSQLPHGPSGTWVDGYNAGNASGYQNGYKDGVASANGLG